MRKRRRMRKKRAERKIFRSRVDVCVQQLLSTKKWWSSSFLFFPSISFINFFPSKILSLSLQNFSPEISFSLSLSLSRNFFILLQWIFTHQNLIFLSFFPPIPNTEIQSNAIEKMMMKAEVVNPPGRPLIVAFTSRSVNLSWAPSYSNHTSKVTHYLINVR